MSRGDGLSDAPAVTFGIDIGGTRIKAAAVTVGGQVLARTDRTTVEDSVALIAAVRETIAALNGETGKTPAAIGIASPGLAARDNRRIIWMRGRLAAVEGLVWQERLREPAANAAAGMTVPVRVLNDAHAAALGEAWIGAVPGRRDVLMLTLGTGVGGGVICDGRLLQGCLGRAGHLGHLCLNLDGPADIVGTPGSLEDLVGDHTVRQRSDGRFHNTAELVAAVAAGDAHAETVWQRTIHALACGLVSLINCFDPELVILGGGIANAGPRLFEPLRAAMNLLEWRPTGEAVPIVPAALGDLAGAIGAAKLALDSLSSAEISHA